MNETDKYLDLPDSYFQDEVALVTGSTSGIGKIAAESIASKGGSVYIHGRDKQVGEELADRLSNEYRVTSEFLRADLSNLNEVRSIATRIEDEEDELDYLINNAGIFKRDEGTGLSNVQYTFVVNHLSHFLLTSELKSLLEESTKGRVVNTASEAHRGIDSFNVRDVETKQNGWEAYSRSKACNIMFTMSLRRRFEGTDMDAVSIHPGVIPGSGFLRNLPGPLEKLGGIADFIPLPGVESTAEGAAMVLYGMGVESDKGPYYKDFGVEKPKQLCLIEKNQENLWNYSINKLGIEEF